MKSIKQILIKRDNMSEEDADSIIEEAKDQMYFLLEKGRINEAETVCEYYFGLEPDYLEDLIL